MIAAWSANQQWALFQALFATAVLLSANSTYLSGRSNPGCTEFGLRIIGVLIILGLWAFFFVQLVRSPESPEGAWHLELDDQAAASTAASGPVPNPRQGSGERGH